MNDLVRLADLKKTFSKWDTTNLFCKLYKVTEIINATIPNYRTDSLKERYNETFLRKTNLSMKQNNDLLKQLKIT